MYCISRRVRGVAAPAVVTLATFLTACGDRVVAPTSPAVHAPSYGKGFTPNGPNSLPQRGRIAYSSNITGDEELYTMNEDGTGILRLTFSPGIDRSPVWSPDGKKVTFIRPRPAGTEVFLMNADGSGIKQLTYLGKPNVGAMTWSPDSRRIAFMVGSSPNLDDYDLYVMNASGGAVTRLTSDTGVEGWPTWSPDGAKIAFATDRTGQSQIFVMNANGTNPTQFTQCVGGCGYPAWSPDGTLIAYQGTSDHSIFTSPVDNSAQVNLVATNAIYPEWAPDGVKLVFIDWLEIEIGTINADGSGRQLVTDLGSDVILPTWGRKQ